MFFVFKSTTKGSKVDDVSRGCRCCLSQIVGKSSSLTVEKEGKEGKERSCSCSSNMDENNEMSGSLVLVFRLPEAIVILVGVGFTTWLRCGRVGI